MNAEWFDATDREIKTIGVLWSANVVDGSGMPVAAVRLPENVPLVAAAPALAAAAIRLLRLGPWVNEGAGDQCVACGEFQHIGPHGAGCEWSALRAALPESLRP